MKAIRRTDAGGLHVYLTKEDLRILASGNSLRLTGEAHDTINLHVEADKEPSSGHGHVRPDPDYVQVGAPAVQPGPRGVQCGKCGMKFDYFQPYGYACQSPGCPMGMGGAVSMGLVTDEMRVTGGNR